MDDEITKEDFIEACGDVAAVLGTILTFGAMSEQEEIEFYMRKLTEKR